MPAVHLQNGAAADAPTPSAARDEDEQAHDEEQIEQIRCITPGSSNLRQAESQRLTSLSSATGVTRTSRPSVSSRARLRPFDRSESRGLNPPPALLPSLPLTDWIQDSLHERTVHVRRGSSRIPPMPSSRFIPRVRAVEDTLAWLWHFTLTVLSDGEDWLVVSAVGASADHQAQCASS